MKPKKSGFKSAITMLKVWCEQQPFMESKNRFS